MCRSGPYVGCLSQNNKFKLYYFRPGSDRFQLLMNTEPRTPMHDFCFAFKPYAKNIGKTDGSDIEREIQVDSPLPFVISCVDTGTTVSVINLESDGRLELRRLIRLPGGFGRVSCDIVGSELFELFYKQYVEGYELQADELPFSSAQVKQEC